MPRQRRRDGHEKDSSRRDLETCKKLTVSKTPLFDTFFTFGRLRKVMKINLYLLAILIVAFCAINICSQDIEEKKDQPSILWGVKFYPVIYGDEDDGLPERIKGRGIIEEITESLISCGAFHWNGTAKIKLLKKVKGYRNEYVYVAVSCFFIRNENLNKVIEFKLSKLRNGEMPGGITFNSIDSKRTAFYRFNKILKNKKLPQKR